MDDSTKQTESQENEKLIWYKACPRCKDGDLFRDEEDAKHCMQCGYRQYEPAKTAEREMAKMFNLTSEAKESDSKSGRTRKRQSAIAV